MSDTSNDAARRDVLKALAAIAAGVGAAPALAQHDHAGMDHAAMGHAMPKAPPTMGVFGKAGAGPGRPVIAMLVHPKMVIQDLIGPLTVFNIMHSEIHLVWKTLTPVSTDVGIPVTPSTRFADCPRDVDILFVPGGLDGTVDAMQDAEVRRFVADCGSRARYVTSDCTGSLLLGAAGLLRGYRATSNWITTDQLSIFGAIPSKERVVQDRNRVTGGGVTAGIDFGLTMCALLKGRALAERVQLTIQYAPQPPFNAGEPETAPKAIVDDLLTARKPAIDRARAAGEALAKAMA